jgi:membrane protein
LEYLGAGAGAGAADASTIFVPAQSRVTVGSLVSETEMTPSVESGPTPKHHRREEVQQKFAGTFAGRLWNRLVAMDFINRGITFAALLLLCFIPFIIVVDALAGRTAVNGLVRRLGLDHQAAQTVGHVFAPASATSGAISGAGYVLFIFGGIAAAGAVQELYEKAFDIEPRGMKNLPQRLLWLAVTIGGGLIAAQAGPSLHSSGGPVLLGVVGFIIFALFWWFSMWLLLAGRIRWRDLLPAAIATGVCWVGMEAVFRLTFSNTVVANNTKYGDIGVVLAFMSYLIAIGVVIIIGAIFGVVWNERKLTTGSASPPPATSDDAGSDSSGQTSTDPNGRR